MRLFFPAGLIMMPVLCRKATDAEAYVLVPILHNYTVEISLYCHKSQPGHRQTPGLKQS